MSNVYLGRVNRWVEKLFNVKGGPTLVDVDPAITVALSFDRPVEEKFQQSWNRFGSAMNGSAVAAQNSGAQIRNPKSSGVVAVVESLIVFQLSVTTRSILDLVMVSDGADFGSIGTNIRLDARTDGQGSSMVVSSGSTAGITNVITGTVVAGVPWQFIQFENQELTVLPGDSLRAVNVTVNEAMTAGFIWRERALESSELT